jgi:transposase-like protein
MDPRQQFCHNATCSAGGQVGQGNIGVHSRAEQRYVCHTCGRTFAATTGTAFYRLRTAADLVTVVLTLLSHGCPPQAIVAAFGLDERTVARWLARAGSLSGAFIRCGVHKSRLLGSGINRRAAHTRG